MLSYLNQDLKFKEYIKQYLDEFEIIKGKLPKDDEHLIPIIAMCVQGIENLIESKVLLGVESGVDETKILEVIYQLETIVGLPKVIKSLNVIHRVIPSVDYDQLNDNEQSGTLTYPCELKNIVNNLPHDIGDFLDNQIRNHMLDGFYQRGNLSLKDKERYLFVAMIAMNLEDQILVRVKSSLSVGNSKEELIWAAISLLPYIGYPTIISTINKIIN